MSRVSFVIMEPEMVAITTSCGVLTVVTRQMVTTTVCVGLIHWELVVVRQCREHHVSLTVEIVDDRPEIDQMRLSQNEIRGRSFA